MFLITDSYIFTLDLKNTRFYVLTLDRKWSMLEYFTLLTYQPALPSDEVNKSRSCSCTSYEPSIARYFFILQQNSTFLMWCRYGVSWEFLRPFLGRLLWKQDKIFKLGLMFAPFPWDGVRFAPTDGPVVVTACTVLNFSPGREDNYSFLTTFQAPNYFCRNSQSLTWLCMGSRKCHCWTIRRKQQNSAIFRHWK